LAFTYWFDKPWFLTEGKPLGVPNWSVIYISTGAIKVVFWRRCRGGRRLLQWEFHTHILYFVLVLLYFIFTCIVLSKNTKKLVSY
jgi:tryptophan-rich sensory protein